MIESLLSVPILVLLVPESSLPWGSLGLLQKHNLCIYNFYIKFQWALWGKRSNRITSEEHLIFPKLQATGEFISIFSNPLGRLPFPNSISCLVLPLDQNLGHGCTFWSPLTQLFVGLEASHVEARDGHGVYPGSIHAGTW